jgi:hypothetical protein
MSKDINNEIQKKRSDRIQLFKDSARLKKTERVLNIGNFYAWVVYDAGQKLSKTYNDYQMRMDAMSRFHEKYEFDIYSDHLTRNPLPIPNALGSNLYTIDDETYSVSMKDFSVLDAGDYDELIKIFSENQGAGFGKFLWKKIVPKKFEKLSEPGASERLRNAAIATMEYLNYIGRMSKIFNDRYGVPDLTEIRASLTFFETLINELRGMKEVSIDLHRIPEKVKALCVAAGFGQAFEKYKASTKIGSNMNTYADIGAGMLGQNFLSKKQFRELYWPGLEKLFRFIEDNDKILFLFTEGDNSRFYEFIKEAPKGHVVFQIEMDDIFQTKKALGDKVCIAGGMPCNLLYHGTVKENVAYAKRLIDEMGPGYIFSTDKMISYPGDCKAENLKAVNDFVRDYRP